MPTAVCGSTKTPCFQLCLITVSTSDSCALIEATSGDTNTQSSAGQLVSSEGRTHLHERVQPAIIQSESEIIMISAKNQREQRATYPPLLASSFIQERTRACISTIHKLFVEFEQSVPRAQLLLRLRRALPGSTARVRYCMAPVRKQCNSRTLKSERLLTPMSIDGDEVKSTEGATRNSPDCRN